MILTCLKQRLLYRKSNYVEIHLLLPWSFQKDDQDITVHEVRLAIEKVQ